MKVLYFFIFITLFNFSSFSQYRSIKYSLGLNIGMNSIMNSEYSGRTFPSFYSSISGRFMFNSHFGLMSVVGYNSFSSERKSIAPTTLVNANIQLIYNLHILRLPSQSNGVLIHTGVGLASLWNSDFNHSNPLDPFFSNNDDIIQCIIGITPQFKLNKNSSLNFDFTYSINLKQNQAFDWEYFGKEFIGMYYHLSIGYTYYFGKQRSILEFPFIFRQNFKRW